MKKNIAKHGVIGMHAELATIRERVHRLTLVRDIVASHRFDQMNHPQLLEKLVAWRRNSGFDKSEVLDERQYRIQGRVCSVDDPEHFEIEIYFEPRWLPSLKKLLRVPVCGHR